jgi:4,5-dihydroxyphthalate decarboxylase
MSRPKITFACSLYDRMMPLYLREVEVEGFDLEFEGSHGAMGARAIFDRMGAQGKAFDVSEMSGSEFISARTNGDDRYVAIPVFPSRAFRSSYIFVNRKKVAGPRDLDGKRIGVPLFTMSAAVIGRGFMADEYGFDYDSCSWVQGNMFQPGKHGNSSAPAMVRPPKRMAESEGKSLSAMLDAGELDATVGAFIPDCYGKNPDVVRLFPNYREVELAYYKKTQVFPIMHLIVIRRSVHEEHPTLARNLFEAFTRSKDIALARMKDVASLEYMLPFLPQDVEEIDEVFGGDPWPYGLERNRPTLEAQIRYLWEQGLTARKVAVDDLFLPMGER